MIKSPRFPPARLLLYDSMSPFKALNREQRTSGEGNKEAALIYHPLDSSAEITANNEETCQLK